jgi:uncharacterized protein YfkK (UPF0435 family)
MSSANGYLLCNLARFSKPSLHLLFSIIALLFCLNTLAADGLGNAEGSDFDLDGDGVENQSDAFKLNAAASVDDDKDGQPDRWNDHCFTQVCQDDSGLTKDPLLNDTDNDGVNNDLDSDYERDNGRPTLLTVPTALYSSVNQYGDFIFDDHMIDQMHMELSASDIVDSQDLLVFKAYWHGIELISDRHMLEFLPSGLHMIDWVAVDLSGNESEPRQQELHIYPNAHFTQSKSFIGEGGLAKITVVLSGESPEYPVFISVSSRDLEGTVGQSDIGEGFYFNGVQQIEIHEFYHESNLYVPIIEDHVQEGDELLVLELIALETDQWQVALFETDNHERIHELTVTDDFDHDGLPDECNLVCSQLGMSADSDSDNDGVENDIDAFKFNAAASVDYDKDGLPDVWNENCLTQACRDDSKLTKDPLLNDTDNDGVNNFEDLDFENDNGKPTILTVPATVHISVNSPDGSALIIDANAVAELTSQLSGEDVVDPASALTAKAYLNNTEIILNEQGGVILASGLHVINWVVVDTSGNESEPLEQLVYIYPKVRFTQSISLTGEGGEASILFELSGESPEYPVSVDIHVDSSVGSIDQGDVDDFELSIPHTFIINEGVSFPEDLLISIVEDNKKEGDELLVLELISIQGAQGAQGGSAFLKVDEQKYTHQLTITEDSDHDGIPDKCNLVCSDLGMIGDTDNDNDGIENNIDAFEFNAAAAIDADDDGRPDVWNENCLTQVCQLNSGLVLDPLPNDTDNDGATNDVDTDLTHDNGKPTLLTIPASISVGVNNADGSGFIMNSHIVDGLLSELSAVDIVDPISALTAKAYLNNVELVRDESGAVTLPSGLLTINWVAIDSSGNESEPMEQLVYIYPMVRFTKSISLVGEGREAKVLLELSGESPEYPVSVEVRVDSSASTVDQGDIENFEFSNTHTFIINENGESFESNLLLSITEDGKREGDELLALELVSIWGNQSRLEYFEIDGQKKTHGLTITEDFDHDGLPDVCNLVCRELDMVADVDNDNDGIENDVDAFEFNAAAAADADNDKMPDFWNEGCLSKACQLSSGLILDPLSNDTDNDGATNDVDIDFDHDNGKPILLTVPEAIHVAVNTTDGSGFVVDAAAVEWHISQLSGVDVVDPSSELTAKAYLNGDALLLDESGEITLPSGLLAINWVVVDSSGNESEPLEQLVYIYPQVRFKSIASVVGEASLADVVVELTGDSPEYPVTVELQVNGILSSVVQDDLGLDFDLSAVQVVVIERGENAELLNREASLSISILEDNTGENDEFLVLELKSVVGEQGAHDFIVLTEQDEAHELTVTYRNLAPTVEILVLQNNQAVTSIALDGGRVSLVAVVSDSNGSDRHTYSWNLDGLIVEDLFGGTVSFEPEEFLARDYDVSVTVTDNASMPLSGSIAQTLTLVGDEVPLVVEDPEYKTQVDEAAASSGGGSSGGGAMGWVLLILISLTLLGQYRRLNSQFYHRR